MANKAPSPQTPFQAWNERLFALERELGSPGHVLIIGVDRERYSDGATNPDSLTANDVAKLRVLLMTTQRQVAIDRGYNVSEGHAMEQEREEGLDDGFVFGNTSTGNAVCLLIPTVVKTQMKTLKNSAPSQFDFLLGLTLALQHNDQFLNDNECWGRGDLLESGLKALAAAWKKTLAKSNVELNIDGTYTRPGVE